MNSNLACTVSWPFWAERTFIGSNRTYGYECESDNKIYYTLSMDTSAQPISEKLETALKELQAMVDLEVYGEYFKYPFRSLISDDQLRRKYNITETHTVNDALIEKIGELTVTKFQAEIKEGEDITGKRTCVHWPDGKLLEIAPDMYLKNPYVDCTKYYHEKGGCAKAGKDFPCFF